MRLRHTSLLDFFFGLYVREVQWLVHRGLVKQYHTMQGNLTALKGRLDFPRHLRHNWCIASASGWCIRPTIPTTCYTASSAEPCTSRNTPRRTVC
ncbi:MAG: hypothetical protein IPH53_22515 [Flavobacteriales bacterium]|nr:hypothetical protein [Flavobacteriales bacterium]